MVPLPSTPFPAACTAVEGDSGIQHRTMPGSDACGELLEGCFVAVKDQNRTARARLTCGIRSISRRSSGDTG